MSFYQLHRCVYDWVRAGEVNSDSCGDGGPTSTTRGYELTDEERKAFESRTSRRSTSSGCTRCCSTGSAGRPDSPGTTTARSSSRSARRKKGRAGGRNSPGVLLVARADDVCRPGWPRPRSSGTTSSARWTTSARRRPASAVSRRCVVLSNEHFTNFFLENFPQLCIGLGEKNWGPTEEWLPIDKVWIPGHPGWPTHIAEHTLHAGFDPAFSHQLELDHGIMTVYYELDNDMKLPLVPIVQNCAVPPLMPVRRAYEFGKALGDAIRSYSGSAAGRRHRGRRAVALHRQPAGGRHRRGVRPLVPRPAGARRARPGARHARQRDRAGRQRQPRDAQLAGGRRCDGTRSNATNARLRADLPVDHRHGRREMGTGRPRRPRTAGRRTA